MYTKKRKEKSQLSVEELVKNMAKNYGDSLLKLVKTITETSPRKERVEKTKKVKEAKEPIKKKQTTYEMFLGALKQIGRPVMTQEVAARFKRIYPHAHVPKSKKLFMQQLYSSASYLTKEGLIVRKPVGKRTYEYSLPEQNTTSVAA